jgi:hypothetical protein
VREDFSILTGLTPETISSKDFSKITITEDYAETKPIPIKFEDLNYYDWAKNATVSATRNGA